MKTIGKVFPPETMFFRTHVGEARHNETGVTYELSNNVGGSAPIIHNTKTGRWFSVSWQEIIELARAAGIDEPVKKKKVAA